MKQNIPLSISMVRDKDRRQTVHLNIDIAHEDTRSRGGKTAILGSSTTRVVLESIDGDNRMVMQDKTKRVSCLNGVHKYEPFI